MLTLSVGLALSLLSAMATRAKASSSQKILQLEIRGNRKISAAAIKARIHSRVGQPFNIDIVDGDIKRIYAMGCFDRVVATTEPDPRTPGGTLVFTVAEKSTTSRTSCAP